MNDKANHHILTKFDEIAQKYDSQRRKLIPCFDDFYNTAASLVQLDHEAPRILDLGAGTGLFSSYMLRKYSQAKLTLIDLSTGMLDIAKERFEEAGASEVTYLAGDYSTFEDAEPYDAIISSLSIHHLEDEAKQTLFSRIFQLLKPGGVFVNADQVLGETPFLDGFTVRIGSPRLKQRIYPKKRCKLPMRGRSWIKWLH